jgi:hypothetical protein
MDECCWSHDFVKKEIADFDRLLFRELVNPPSIGLVNVRIQFSEGMIEVTPHCGQRVNADLGIQIQTQVGELSFNSIIVPVGIVGILIFQLGLFFNVFILLSATVVLFISSKDWKRNSLEALPFEQRVCVISHLHGHCLALLLIDHATNDCGNTLETL